MFFGDPAASQESQNAEHSSTQSEVSISGRRLIAFPLGRRKRSIAYQASTLVAIAVLVAADSGRRVTVAELATAYIVAGVGAELRAIQGFEETAAANLAGNGGKGVLSGGGSSGRILRGIGNARTGAAISVANEDAAGFVHGDVVDVEQIAARIAAAAIPDATALYG